MKKLVVLMLASLMLAGCSGQQNNNNTENTVSIEGAGQEKAEEQEDGGTEKIAHTTEDEKETENEVSEDTSETSDRTQASLSVGGNTSGMAKRGDNAAIYSPLYTSTDPQRKCVFYEKVLTPDSTKEYSVEGNVTNVLIDDNNKAYFMMDDSLYQYTYGGTEECLLSDIPYGELIGEIGSRIYFQYAGPEMDVVTMHLAYYDTESGQQNEIQAGDLQGDVEFLIGGSHFFYIGGRTDASAKPLYEIDANSSEVTQIDDYVVGMAYDEGGNLYYTASESADYLSNPLIVKKYDTETGKVSEIFRETEDTKIGSIVAADNNYLYFQEYDGVDTVLSCWNLEKEALENIKRGTNIKYVPDCEYQNNFYFSQYSTDSEGTIISSELYKYLGENEVDTLRNVQDGLGLVANEIEGDIQGAAGNCLFYVGQRETLTDYRIEGFHAAV